MKQIQLELKYKELISISNLESTFIANATMIIGELGRGGMKRTRIVFKLRGWIA